MRQIEKMEAVKLTAINESQIYSQSQSQVDTNQVLSTIKSMGYLQNKILALIITSL